VTTAAGTTEALDSEFGTLTWKYDAGGSSGGSLALSQLVVGSDNGGVSAIDPASGAILWSVATGADITVGPTISGSLVVVASGQTLYGYDLTSGKQLFAYATGYTIQIPPVVINGLIYVGGRDGYLDAIAGDAPSSS
jgi:eukaryotic-like serine/threonine-protein kinase